MAASKSFFLLMIVTGTLLFAIVGFFIVQNAMVILLNAGWQGLMVPWGAKEHPELLGNPVITLSWMLMLLSFAFLIFSSFFYLLEILLSRKHILLNPKDISKSLTDQLINELKNETVAVIPAHDEEDTIFEVVRETLKYVREVIVINDGSRDRTAEKARKAGAIVLDNPRKMGLCHTMLRGLKVASERDGRYVVTLDADGQYLPEEIPYLIYPLHQGQAEVVLGSRLKGTIEYMPLVKRFGNWAFTRVLRKFSGVPISDGQTGFRAFKKEILWEIIPLHHVKHTYTQQQIIILGTKNIKVHEVPITFKKRSHGTSRLMSNPFQYAFNGWHVILVSLLKNKPFHFLGTIGAFLLALFFPPLLHNMLVFFIINQFLVNDLILISFLMNSFAGFFFIGLGFVLNALKNDMHGIID